MTGKIVANTDTATFRHNGMWGASALKPGPEWLTHFRREPNTEPEVRGTRFKYGETWGTSASEAPSWVARFVSRMAPAPAAPGADAPPRPKGRRRPRIVVRPIFDEERFLEAWLRQRRTSGVPR
jgi:hypothetical protein